MGTATLEATKANTVERWYTIPMVMEITGFKRTFLYAEMESGRLRSVKAGGGRRVPESALAAWQASFDGSGEVVGS